MKIRKRKTDRTNTCKRCGHSWNPYKPEGEIRQCPKCKSAWWDKEKKENERTKN